MPRPWCGNGCAPFSLWSKPLWESRVDFVGYLLDHVALLTIGVLSVYGVVGKAFLMQYCYAECRIAGAAGRTPRISPQHSLLTVSPFLK